MINILINIKKKKIEILLERNNSGEEGIYSLLFAFSYLEKIDIYLEYKPDFLYTSIHILIALSYASFELKSVFCRKYLKNTPFLVL